MATVAGAIAARCGYDRKMLRKALKDLWDAWSRVWEQVRQEGGWWPAFLVVVGVLGAWTLRGEAPCVKVREWLSDRSLAIGVLLLGVALSQGALLLLRDLAAGLSALKTIEGNPNRWPQRFIGLAEAIGYAVGFATLDTEKFVTGAGAWIAFKQFGTWRRGTTVDAKDSNLSPEAKRREDQESDERRRRFFVFLFANVLQVGFGAATGAALKWALS
jgi:hypothetical protein